MPIVLWCKAPGIYHLPPTDLLENTPFMVEVIADANFPPPESVLIYYRNSESDHFQELATDANAYVFRAVIPVEAVVGDSLRYFIIGNFGKQGIVGLPANTNPKQQPYAVHVVKLADVIKQGSRLKVKQDSQVKGNVRFVEKPMVSVAVITTPWRIISTKYTAAEIPEYFQKLPDSASECGMIRAEGNQFAGYVELYAAVLNRARQERADGFTQLRYNAYTRRNEQGKMSSLPVMEAVYFSFGPTHQY